MAKKGSKGSDNFGLMIAALVAIVAVVGLVILFSSKGGTGAVTNVNAVCEGNWQYQFDAQGGGWVCSTAAQPVGGAFPEGGAYADSWGVSRELREDVDQSRGFTQQSQEWLNEKTAI